MNLVVCIKGWVGNWYSKLSKYNLNNGIISQDLWYFDKAEIVSSGIKIGTCNDPYYPCSDDKDKTVQCLKSTLLPPTRVSGTYTINDKALNIKWSWGDTEIWNYDGLKWVLISASYLQNDKHGWAFATEPFEELNRNGIFTGEYARYNGWNGINEPVKSDMMTMPNLKITNTGVMRAVNWDCSQRTWVFRYLAMINNMVVYQISHDFNNDGNIEDDKGHTYIGLPIIKNKVHTGFVFADASIGGTFSALYYH